MHVTSRMTNWNISKMTRPHILRFLLLCTVGLWAAPSATQAQTEPITLESPNSVSAGQFGASVADVPDADGDGQGDLLVGAVGEGRAYLFSGTTGQLLQTLENPESGSYARSVAGVPDADGDGRGDLLVGGAPNSYLYSGATGELLQTFVQPNTNSEFGFSVAGVSDADGDGRGDLLIGAHIENVEGTQNAGRAYLYSGATGELLQTLETPNPEIGGAFGQAVAGVPDVDGDGRGDLLIGARNEDGGALDAGRGYLFSGATGALLQTLVSPNPQADGRIGWSVSGVPDVDGDGRGDLLVGAVSEFNESPVRGQAHVFSGATGELIRSHVSLSTSSGGDFAWSVAGVPDMDGDGRGDVLIGSVSDSGGRAFVFSGATGQVLQTLESPEGGLFGISASGVPDVDGDGRGDLLIGARSAGSPNSGRAYLYRSGGGLASAPNAVDDTATTLEGFATFVDAAANDTDANGDDLLVLTVGAAMNGMTQVDDDGVRYVPDPGFIGTDSFTYTVVDGNDGSDEGTVTVTVIDIPENVQPFASPDPETDDSFGIGVSSVPDVNADGIDDVLVGAADENGQESLGRAYLYSGATGVLLRTLTSPAGQVDTGFGISVAGVSDVNGDGAGDLLIGAYLENESIGRAYLFSGATGTLLRTLESPSSEPFQFGWQVAAVPDTDGDAIEDFVVGSPGGMVYVFSGSTGLLLQTLESPELEVGLFGFAVAGLPDVDGDGRGDLVVGAASSGPDEAGRVHVFSGATGELLRTLQSPNPENASFFGFPVAGIADVSGDGLGDVLVGAFLEDSGAMNAGRAYVFDGATGDVLRTLTSPNPEEGGWFGIGLSSVPDADGDEQEDILVGALGETGDGAPGGRAHLFSGPTGLLIRTLESPVDEAGGAFGRTVVAGVPDLDGDGLGELLVGARGEEGGAKNAGRAYLFYSGEDGNMPPVAVGDAAVTTAGVSVLIDVLANDSDPDGDPITIASVGSPRNGSAKSWGKRSATPRSRASTGVDSFLYTLDGGTDDALVVVTVTPSAGGSLTLDSPNSVAGGQFGLSVAGVPDIDGDGQGDLLIGAVGEEGVPMRSAVRRGSCSKR